MLQFYEPARDYGTPKMASTQSVSLLIDGQSVTVPAGARIAVFNSTGNFYANWLAAAAVPTANITDGSGPELNPVARDISGLASFSLIAPANCVVTVAYFA